MTRRTLTRRTLGRLLWFALVCWAGIILWLSSLTPQELPDAAFMFWDKANHFAAFVFGGWLAAAALRVSRPGAPLKNLLLLAVLLVAAFGALDEAVQTLTPGRTGGDLDDWLADLFGATAGALLTVPTLPRLLRRQESARPER